MENVSDLQTAYAIINDPKALYISVYAKDIKRILALLKKFNTNTVIEISPFSLIFTTSSIRISVGVIDHNNWPDQLVIRTTFNILSLQKFLVGANDEGAPLLITFKAPLLQMYKNQIDSIVLEEVNVIFKTPFIPTFFPLIIMNDPQNQLRTIYDETQKKGRIGITNTADANQTILFTETIHTIFSSNQTTQASYLFYLFKEQLDFLPAFTCLLKDTFSFGYCIVLDEKHFEPLYFRVLYQQQESNIFIEINIPFKTEYQLNLLSIPSHIQKEKERKTNYLTADETIEIISTTEPLIGSSSLPLITIKENGQMVIDYACCPKNEEEEEEEEKEEDMVIVECPRCKRHAAKRYENPPLTYCPICEDWTEGKEALTKQIDWESKEKYLKRYYNNLTVFKSTPNTEYAQEVIKLNNLDPFELTPDDIYAIIKDKINQEKEDWKEQVKVHLHVEETILNERPEGQNKTESWIEDLPQASQPSGLTWSSAEKPSKPPRKYVTKLEVSNILRILRNTKPIPGDALEKILYLIREFLKFVVIDKREKDVFKRSYSLDYFSTLYLLDKNFDIGLGLFASERKIPKSLKEVFEDFLDHFIEKYNDMKLGRLNRNDKFLLTKLIGLSPRERTAQTTNYILSYFYEEKEEDLPSLINELGVFSEKICQIENGLDATAFELEDNY